MNELLDGILSEEMKKYLPIIVVVMVMIIFFLLSKKDGNGGGILGMLKDFPISNLIPGV